MAKQTDLFAPRRTASASITTFGGTLGTLATSVVTLAALSLSACQRPTEPTTNATHHASDIAASSTGNAYKPAKKIAISAIVEHPSLDAIRQGVIDELSEQGYQVGQNLSVQFQSAQGNTATAGQIAKQFAADNPDVIVAISTPTAQAIAAATRTIPIVYTAVSDPVAAKLIDAHNTPTQANITGLSSQLPLAPQLDFMQKIVPNLHTVGYVYSSGEINAVALGKRLQAQLPARNLQLLQIPANRATDIAMATNSLVGKAQVIYTSMDNNVASAFESMVQVANQAKLPIVASDEFSVRRGAAAALGVNDYNFGRKTGEMVVKILDGASVQNVAPAVMDDLTMYVSPKHAAAQGISIPPELMQGAVNVDDMPAKDNMPTK